MALYSDLSVYKDTLTLAKRLRVKIYKLTNNYYKYGIGEEICRLLRDIKFQISKTNARGDENKLPYIVELSDQLNHLTILIDEMVEDNIFKLDGKGNIIQEYKILINVKSQVSAWRKSIQRKIT